MDIPNVTVDGAEMEVKESVFLGVESNMEDESELLSSLLDAIFQLVRKIPLGFSDVTAPIISYPEFELDT